MATVTTATAAGGRGAAAIPCLRKQATDRRRKTTADRNTSRRELKVALAKVFTGAFFMTWEKQKSMKPGACHCLTLHGSHGPPSSPTRASPALFRLACLPAVKVRAVFSTQLSKLRVFRTSSRQTVFSVMFSGQKLPYILSRGTLQSAECPAGPLCACGAMRAALEYLKGHRELFRRAGKRSTQSKGFQPSPFSLDDTCKNCPACCPIILSPKTRE